jgi:hypothetical protein
MMPFIQRAVTGLLPGLLVIALAGCVSVGREFPRNAVERIKPGTTTMEEVRKLFGNPIRTGIDDGKLTWTYLDYRASLGGSFDGADLLVKFDDRNRVSTFSFNSTDVERKLR